MRAGTTNTEQQQPYYPGLTPYDHALNIKTSRELFPLRNPTQAEGQEIAVTAVGFLYGVTNAHYSRFNVGDKDSDVSMAAQNNSRGFDTTLEYLTEKGAVVYCESSGLYLACNSENMPEDQPLRALERTEEFKPQSARLASIAIRGIVIRPNTSN